MALIPLSDTDSLIRESERSASRYVRACEAGILAGDDPRFAAATALAGGADRLVITSSGPGFDAASFGATAFSESGFDAVAIHAGDLVSATGRFRPHDVLIGIDSESASVAGALRRARRSGVHTIGLTTRGLTILDADVLVQVAALDDAGHDAGPATLVYSLALGLMAARLEPDTPLASEIKTFPRMLAGISARCADLGSALTATRSSHGRLVLAGRGDSLWAVNGLARGLNMTLANEGGFAALATHLNDIEDGLWSFSAHDMLIEIDPQEPVRQHRADDRSHAATRPLRHWSFSAQPSKLPGSVKLPVSSPALASLLAFSALSRVFAEFTHAGRQSSRHDV